MVSRMILSHVRLPFRHTGDSSLFIPHFYVICKQVCLLRSTAQSALHFELHGIRRVSSAVKAAACKQSALFTTYAVLFIANAESALRIFCGALVMLRGIL